MLNTILSKFKSILAPTAVVTVLTFQPNPASAQTVSCCTSKSIFFRQNMSIGYEYFTSLSG